MASDATYWAKGVWFSTARRHIVEEHGNAALQAVLDKMDAQYRPVLEDPIPSEWYPEDALQELLFAMGQALAGGQREQLERELEGLARRGMRGFLSALLQLSSTRFVLRRVPTAWKMLRKGPGWVEVQHVEGGTEVSYRDFPYLHDLSYRLLTRASLRALVEESTGERASIETLDYTDDSMRVRIRHR